MKFFKKEFIEFFQDLRKYNNRDWFQDNKKQYELHVKEPFKNFVGHMILKMREVDPGVLITPKQAIFRIYRDIRFSKDKTPYKEHVSAVISKGGRKDMTSPGIYLQMNDEEIRIYSGIYKPDKSQLEAIRNHIAAQPETFRKLYEDKTFKKLFGEIRGEKNKRLPRHFTEAAEVEPLIYNKGFYYFDSLPPEAALKENLDEVIMKHYHAAGPLNNFFTEAFKQS